MIEASSPEEAICRKCARENRDLSISYLDGKGERTERVITPLWVFDNRKVHAQCHLRGEDRDFLFERMVILGLA